MNAPRFLLLGKLFGPLLLSTALVAIGTSAILAQGSFSIAVDGQQVAGDLKPDLEPRKTDRDLAAADIKVTYDGLDGARRLQAGLISARAEADQVTVVLGLDTNYGAWIDRAEFRLFVAGENKPIAVVPAKGRKLSWSVPAGVTGDVHYVARVYDAEGRYDETQLATLSVKELRQAGAVGPNVVSGGDTTAMRSIPVHGGTVTVSDASIPPGTSLSVMGETVTTDADGRFVLDRILPTGDHVVDIAMSQPDGTLVTFRRDVNIPTNDWFYVGLADLTVGTRWGDGALTDARPEEFDAVYYKGRAAFYLKGKIRGEYLLTAAADSGEGPLSEMLTGVLSTDPQAVLRRIDPSQYYPVYGDGSQLVDDAPTSGKLYVRLERGPSHVMWGNFRTTIGDASILRTQRSLYGASSHLETEAVTARGDAVAKGSAYLAQPQTAAARDVLRGTGGSAYVLRRQDMVPGSEIITVEVVNAITGAVVETRRLRPGVDYTINYMQGLVILTQPLSSSRLGTGAVQSSQPDVINLAVQYEYRPAGGQLSDYAFGASGSTWLGDHLRVGAVALSETGSRGEDLTVVGVNARVQADQASFIEAEILRSQGQGQAEWMSIDGGFTFVQQPVLTAARKAYAYRVSAGVDLSKLIDASFAATAGVTLEGRQKGFSTTSQQTLQDTLSASAFLTVALNQDVDLGLKVDHIENAGGTRRSEIGAELQYALGADLVVTAGLIHRDTFQPGGAATHNGNRTDLGVRLSYQVVDDLTLHAFGQVTAYASPGYDRNDRVGLGAEWQVNEQWSIGAEGSIGSSGPQVVAMATHSVAPGERTYLGVRLAPDGSDDFFTRTRSINGLVAGGSRRLNEAVSVFAENTYGLFNDAGRLNALYGVNFTPDHLWSSNLTYETGTIQHDLAGQLDRHAISGALAFKDDGIDWSNRAELRLERSADGSKDRTTALGKSAVSVQTSNDWRMMGGISALISQSDQSSILDGDYIEANIGAAYRPTSNDRLNALIRYSYLYDLPGPQQVARNNSVMGPAQRSHVFSVDANYDVTENVTLGGKYGFRIGEVSASRAADAFIFSSAHLFILRADMGITTDWHVLGEIRGLLQPEISAFSPGALAMVSYDVNDTVRAGVGYNVGGYSDDLRDLSFDKHGLFLNLAARF
jgi:hypothetical protein